MAAALPYLAFGANILGKLQENAATEANARAQQQRLQADAAAATYNRQIAEQNASIVDQQTQAELELADKQRRLRAGQSRAAAGASGIGGASFNDVLNANAKEEKLNLLTIKSDGALRADSYRQQATLYGMSAQGALDQIPYVKSAAKSSKAASVISGVSKGINSF